MQIILGTRNKNKVKEVKAIFENIVPNVQIISLDEIDPNRLIEEPIEEQPVKPARELPVFEEDEEDDNDDFVPAPIHTRPRRLDDEDLDRMFEPVDEDELPKKKTKKKKNKKKRKAMDPTVQPVKAGKLFIAQLLIKIPIIGIIFALIFAVNKKANKNIRTYAKLAFLWHAIGLALFIFFLATDGFGYLISWIFDLFNIKGIKF